MNWQPPASLSAPVGREVAHSHPQADPGISLMAEFAGLAYFAEIPAVFWNITRMGPSTGLPTRTSQGDLLFTHFLGHGDSRQICLLPGNLQEAFEFGWKSFDISEALQTPVFVVSDLDLGMNNWLSDPFEYPDQPINRGKVLNADELQSFIDEHGKWGRYLDVDGDGITYRTIPGTDHRFRRLLHAWYRSQRDGGLQRTQR